MEPCGALELLETTGLLALPTETRGEANAGAGTMHEVPTPEPYLEDTPTRRGKISLV